MQKNNIISAIEEKVGATSFKLWTIGVTNDPAAVKEHLENVDAPTRYWSTWQTDSESDAQEILNYFTNKGMDLNHGFNSHWDWVYVF